MNNGIKTGIILYFPLTCKIRKLLFIEILLVLASFRYISSIFNPFLSLLDGKNDWKIVIPFDVIRTTLTSYSFLIKSVNYSGIFVPLMNILSQTVQFKIIALIGVDNSSSYSLSLCFITSTGKCHNKSINC